MSLVLPIFEVQQEHLFLGFSYKFLDMRSHHGMPSLGITTCFRNLNDAFIILEHFAISKRGFES